VLNQIEHIVVLMLENRSFDCMLGKLYAPSPQFDGLTGTEFNVDAAGRRLCETTARAFFYSGLDCCCGCQTNLPPHPCATASALSLEERALARVSKDGRESSRCIHPSRRLLRKPLRMRAVFLHRLCCRRRRQPSRIRVEPNSGCSAPAVWANTLPGGPASGMQIAGRRTF